MDPPVHPPGSSWAPPAARAAVAGHGSARGGLVLLLLFSACTREIPILLYHEVGCGTRDARDVPAAEFDQELGWLAGAGYTFVPPEVVEHPERAPDKAIALTFDDGAACLYTRAFPALLRRRVPFALFLPTGWIGADAAHRTRQKLEDGEEVDTLVWPEVAAMVKSGLARVGAHGREHVYLRKLGAAALANEVGGSRDDVLARTGGVADLFAYPFGAFDGRVAGAARAAGYRAAFAVGAGLGGTFAYRRRSVHRGADEAALMKLVGPAWILPWLNHD